MLSISEPFSYALTTATFFVKRGGSQANWSVRKMKELQVVESGWMGWIRHFSSVGYVWGILGIKSAKTSTNKAYTC